MKPLKDPYLLNSSRTEDNLSASRSGSIDSLRKKPALVSVEEKEESKKVLGKDLLFQSHYRSTAGQTTGGSFTSQQYFFSVNPKKPVIST